MTNLITLHAVGDVAPRRSDPASIFSQVLPQLGDADVLFGQMECVLSTRGSPAPNAKLAMRSDPAVARTLHDAGFDVMSAAGNHALDYGAEALMDTLEALNGAAIITCGAGRTLPEARRPAIIETQGKRIVFLAYSSILPTGYVAEMNRAGCAPLRAHTHYEQIEHDQPGTPPRIHTFADAVDLNALLDDVRAARAEADVLALSMHWGIHFVRADIADYQRELAHAAIDAGADMILGHHPHLLKGVEIYQGKPIFYSLGNFAIEQPSAFKADVHLDRAFADVSALGTGWKPGARYMTPPETRYTIIARCRISPEGKIEASAFPCWINDNSDPELLNPTDPRFDEVVDYLTAITREAGLSTRYERRGGELAILDQP